MHTVFVEFVDVKERQTFIAERVAIVDGWLLLRNARHEAGDPNALVDIAYPASRVRVVMAAAWAVGTLPRLNVSE